MAPSLRGNLSASNYLKRTEKAVLTDKTFNIASVHPAETIPGMLHRDERVPSMLPLQIAAIKNQKKTLHNNESDLKPEPIATHLSDNTKDLLANANSNIVFKGFSLSNSSGMLMQSSSNDLISYPGTFASQLATSMYLNSVKLFDNTYLSSSNIGTLFQNKNRNYLPPVTFGLNINLSLENNWNIETGIQYTRLQSNGTVSIHSSNAIQFSTSFGYKVTENLHYLGVPFIINYNFSQKKKTAYYVSAGFSIEKGLIAKYVANPEDNYPGMAPIYSHNAIKGLQYSLSTGIGISYKFIPHFQLFGQPSVSYYFESQGRNTTVYSIHPLLFNLRTGIRYTIK